MGCLSKALEPRFAFAEANMADFVMVVQITNSNEDEIRELVQALKATLGERGRTRTLTRLAWDDERKPVLPPAVVHRVVPLRRTVGPVRAKKIA